MDYVVIYEKGDSSYGAYVPDLPGCIAVGETLEEVHRKSVLLRHSLFYTKLM